MAHPACWRQLEQQLERRVVGAELEQRPLERQQQHRVPSRSPRKCYQNSAAYGLPGSVCAKRSLAPPPTGGNIDRTLRPVRFFRAAAAIPRKGRMKTVSGLWHQVVDYDALHAAYKRAALGKRYQAETLRFSERIEENLIDIQNSLQWKMYQPQPLREFTIREPKERLISAPTFRDRVVHHALVAAIEPAFERRFIKDSYACRTGRGMHASALRLQHFTRLARRFWGRYWVVKIDIRKYFASVDHKILKAAIRRSISDRRVLELCDTIIDSHATSPGTGLPIGALTSQLFANVYLDQLDHRCKEAMRLRYYVRYMDDVVVLARSKSEARATLEQIGGYCHGTLRLELNARSGIWPGRHGIDFCGYRIWPTHLKPRKRTIARAKHRLAAVARRLPAKEAQKTLRELVTSFVGYLRHCTCRDIFSSVISRAQPQRKTF